MKRFILLLICLLTISSLWAKDIKTLVVTTTPAMHCASCENKIKGNLRFEKGVQSITTNVAEQTVTIVYDADKITAEELLKAFAKFGYAARVVVPKPEKVAKEAKPDKK